MAESFPKAKPRKASFLRVGDPNLGRRAALTCLPASSPRKNGERNAFGDDSSYLIAWSVIAEVQAPEGSLVMIFWSSSALAVRS
jgi:hypothetical protein